MPGSRFSEEQIVEIPKEAEGRGRPAAIAMDNGPEFTSRVLEAWRRDYNGVRLGSSSGKIPSIELAQSAA